MGTNDDLNNLLNGAVADGILSASTQSMLSGDLGKLVIAGADGLAMEDIVASHVTLVTTLIDSSSSIASRGLEQAVRDGQNGMVDAFAGSKEKDAILMALWTFASDATLQHAYVAVDDALRLDASTYHGAGSTSLYDTWCAALVANVAYAQRLRDGGTPCRSIVVVITDGEDVGSKQQVGDCARLSRDVLASEQFVLAFVGVGADVDFRAVARQMGIPDASVAIQRDATPGALRTLFQMVSQSAIRASQTRVNAGGQVGFFAP